MASVEASSSTHGPRYAPDDPTLPQPWKGLIDGSTGVLYYWNPETNVTQYEKPTALPPPLPPGPPPAAPTPKLNPIPSTRTVQSDGFQNQKHAPALMPQGQLISSSSQQHIQLTPQVSQHQVPPPGQVQGSHLGPGIQQQGHLAPEQIRTQIVEQPGKQVPSLLGQMPTHPGQLGISQPTPHIPTQPGSQASYLQMQQIPHDPQGQMYSNSQMGNPHGFQFNPHQASYAVHQQNMPPQGPQSLQPSQHLIPGSQLPHQLDQVTGLAPRDDSNFLHGKHSGFSAVHQHMMQGQQFPRPREQKNGIPQIDDVEYQQGKKAGFSPAQVQQSGTPSMQNLSAVASSTQASNMSTMPNQTTLYGGGSSVNMQQTNPSLQLHQAGTDLAHSLHGSRFPNQMDPGMMHSQQQNLPPVASKMAYEDHIGRTGNDFNHSTNKGAPAMHQLPKLAPLPMARNQQEMKMGDFPQNVTPIVPGRLNGPGPSGGPALHGVYGHTSGAPPFPNNAFPSPPSAMMGSTDPIHLSAVEIYRRKHEVTATGEDVPAPFMTFETTGFPPEILQEMHFAGFSAPTPIQAQTWPIALLNKDIVAIAKTGSGKTLGYLIPAFIHLRRRQNNPQNGPTVLVLAPTRELATQIQDEVLKFGRSSRVSCTCLYGGAPKGLQLKELDRGVDIVVATPGRLNDILEMKRIDFRQISFLVLDEADRMLDMGFEPQIRKIVNEIPPRRQTLMYTATWPKEVRKIASDLLVNPVQVNIGSVDELTANKAITQHVEVVPEMEKQRRLEQILRSQERGSKCIIFCSTKKLCDQLARSIGRNFGAAVIHGDKSQGERDWVLNQFRTGKSPVLVATDVAARGLDIRDIRVVINYDFPTGIEDYVHRIGRTGRAGATGVSYTFFSEQDWKHALDLVKVLEGANQHVPPEVRDIALHGGPGFSKDRVPMNRYDSAGGGGRWDSGGRGGRWDSGGRGGMRDGFGGRGGMRDGGFGGRGGMRDGGRGGMRHDSFGGPGGMRDVGFNGRGGTRDGNFGGRSGGRDGGPSGVRLGWDRGGRGTHDRFNNLDVRGRGRGRGRFDSRRDGPDRSRGQSFSRSPDRVRTWGSSRSRSSSGSRSRGRSYSRSRSRSRSWSRSRSPRSSRSWSHSPRRSRSRSYDRYERRPPRKTKFDQVNVSPPKTEAAPSEPLRSLVSPGTGGNEFTGVEPAERVPLVAAADLGNLVAEADPSNNPPVEP